MSLALYGHPFSSYTQKVLIALYENGTPFEFRTLGPDTPEHSAEWLRRWPLRKFPLLVDGERNIVETSIIIEYLQLTHPGPMRLLPADPNAALDVRFLDRFFDLHVMNAAQHAVDGALTGDPVKRQGKDWRLLRTSWNAPTRGSKGILPGGPGLSARNSRWPTARQRPRSFTRTGRIGFLKHIPCCVPTASGCSRAHPSPGQ